MKSFFSLIMLLFTLAVSAQVPQAFRYQAVARDASGNILANKQISVRITIHDSSATGTALYVENHKEGTNDFGLFSISIGRGLPVSGTFAAIPWAAGEKWMQTEIDPLGGSAYSDMGTAQLLSVPYALYAASTSSSSYTEDSTNELQTLSISGNDLSISLGNTVSLPSSFNTGFNLNGTTLSITDGGGTLNVDLSTISGGGGSGWQLTGNSGTNASTNFVGTTDNTDLVFRTNNTEKMRLTGSGSLGVGTASPAASAKVDITSTTQGVLFPSMSSAQRQAIAAPSTGLLVYDLSGNILMQYNGNRWLEVGSPPLGTIQAWHKSFTGTPALPWGWVECDGQTINDTESPYNGTATPNLNATFTTEAGVASSAGRFLRGSTTSGTLSSDKTNNVAQIGSNGANGCGLCDVNIPQDGTYPAGNTPGYDRNNANTSARLRHRAVETTPGNMTVVWIMRVK